MKKPKCPWKLPIRIVSWFGEWCLADGYEGPIELKTRSEMKAFQYALNKAYPAKGRKKK